MKEFIRYSLLFVVLLVAVLGTLSCSGPVDQNANVVNANTASSDNAVNRSNGKEASPASDKGASQTGGEKVSVGKSEDYPPLSSAIAQSELKNLDGTTFTVADKKGKVLLLNMWATWCGPCRAEMPALVEMHDKYNGEFEVLGLNVDDEPKDMIDKFAAELKLNYPLVWADSALQNELVRVSSFGGIPQSFLVDRQGHLRAVFKGGSPREIAKMRAYVDGVVNE